jgi:hypothetical protein
MKCYAKPEVQGPGLMQAQSAPLHKPDREIAEAPRISSADFFYQKAPW